MATSLGNTCVFGLAWGDEGKGKIVDLLCPGFDIVSRYNGGANAGHTVKVGNQSFALHLLPSGVLHPHNVNVIGPGVVIDPEAILHEADELAKVNVNALNNLRISDRAHMVLPYHKLEDQLGEKNAGDAKKIGTTARGIGPCYADKMRRNTAFRMVDLLRIDEIDGKLRDVISRRQAYLQAEFGYEQGIDADAILAMLRSVAPRLAPCICDTTTLLHDSLGAGNRILFEGANGLLLD
ncbi:MAG: adenylosuccinate synthetase, partial [Phycisphaerae bacterium]